MNGTADAYSAFQEGSRLLDAGSPHAAVVVLERARDLEPEQGSIRETLARAYFRSGRYAAAEVEFRAAIELDPVNDYAHFGVGVCRLRAGDRQGAHGHLQMATVMRPDNSDYRAALAESSPDESDESDEADANPGRP